MNSTLDTLRTVGVRAQPGTTSVRMRRPAWPAVKQQVDLGVVRAEDPGPFVRRADAPVGLRGPLDSPSSSATHTESDTWAAIWSPNDQLVIFKWISDTSTKIASTPYTRR